VSTGGDQSDSDYEVGYGKPPEQFRFKKGQSGNPKGRPRGSKNFMTLLHKGLEQRVPVQENGRRRRISKREAMVTQAINKAASGDLKALQFLLPQILTADAMAQARREERSNPAYGETVNLLAGAVQILADLGVELPVPKTRARAAAQIETRRKPEDTTGPVGPMEYQKNTK
jgi:hypothetical protein